MNMDNVKSIDLGKYRDPAYEREMSAYFQSRLPGRVFDAHFHVVPGSPLNRVDGDENIENWRAFLESFLGKGHAAGGLVLPDIVPRPRVDAINDYAVEQASGCPGFAAGMLICPDQDPEAVEAYLLAHHGITTFKPYNAYSVNSDRLHSSISEFVPEWMWALADRHRMSVTLHITRYTHGLDDPDTLSTVLRVCEEYPNMRLILAHCALAHNPDTLKRSIARVRHLDNLWFDSSGIGEPLAICHVLDGFGPGRLLYGSDWSFGRTLGRIVQLGNGLIGLDPGFGHIKLDFPPDWDCCFVPNAMEGLNVLLNALDLYGIGSEGQRAIFWDNAQWLFRMDAQGRSHRADADRYDREVRRGLQPGCPAMAKGCVVWSRNAVPLIDTCSDALRLRPLGYADMRVGTAVKEAGIYDQPEGDRTAKRQALCRLLLARYPWARQVVLTRGETAAETVAAQASGRTCVLDESLGNGTSIGAALLENPVEAAVAPPDFVAVNTTLAVCGIEARDDALEAVRKRVVAIWKELETDLNLRMDIDADSLTFSLDPDVLKRFEANMLERGFIASNRFCVTLAHTDSVLRRYALAATEALAEVLQSAEEGPPV